MSEDKHESGGAKAENDPVLSLDALKEKIKRLAPGTKERLAWEELGAKAPVTREQFRDLWLEIRCRPAAPQAKAKTDGK